jgi:NAD(P)-dependent dehydrogenase (short-subunit alcohol dehydrogenase family)
MGRAQHPTLAAGALMRNKRVCILTGAGGTLGTALCRLYAHKYNIVAIYRNTYPQVPTQAQRLVDPVLPHANNAENDNPVFAIQADLSKDVDLARMVQIALARFERIDLLVNAAVHSFWGPIIDSTKLIDSAQQQFVINALVPLKLAALLANEFWRNRAVENRRANRNIVNVSSTAGLYAYPHSHQTVYSASKAALNYASLHMADEFADFGVRVNVCAPNAFPGIVPTRSVAQAIQRLDEGKMTRKILILDYDGEYFYE